MPTWLWILIAVGGGVVVLAGLWGGWVALGRQRLRSEFGREYDHAVRRMGNRKQAEDELRERRERREQVPLRSLGVQERARYQGLWGRAKESFVDDPESAVHEGERLIRELMSLRGYPQGDFDQRAVDLSMEDPDLAARYRKAHDVARGAHGKTDDLRRAMREYEGLFFAVLETGAHESKPSSATG